MALWKQRQKEGRRDNVLFEVVSCSPVMVVLRVGYMLHIRVHNVANRIWKLA